MKKKYKLKKEVRYCLIALIIAICMVVVGKSIYKDYVWKNSYEYKLENHGYKEDEVKLLIKELNNKKLEELLRSKKDDTIISFLKAKYYIKQNLDRYLDYYQKHPKAKIEDVIALINTNGDYEHYEHDLKSDTSKKDLIICNKYYKLDKDYEPDDIVEMDNKYYYGETQKVRQNLYDAFINMWNAANEEGIYLIVNSSYRTYADQEETYNYYKDTYSEEYADSIAARPGYSEHQTGLAIDIFSKSNTARATFKESNAYKWLTENAYKYGFILRYEEGKEHLTGYDAESWHYRYVGIDVAKQIHKAKLTYDEYYAYYIENSKK